MTANKMNIKNKKILITGGASFIGFHTVNALLKEGAKVIILDNFLTGRKENINPLAKLYELNVNSLEAENVFEKEKPEIVYHLAFNRLFLKSVENPLLDMDSISGSINIFMNAKKYGVKKVIFPSSGFIYGVTNKMPLKETDPVRPISPYAIAKTTVENYLRFFKKVYNLSYVILRYATIYGPRQDMGAMADYIRKLSSGKQAEIFGSGKMTRDYVYIDDVVKANLLALNVPDGHPDPVFNVGTGEETTVNELYEKIAKLLNKTAKPVYLPGRPEEQTRYVLDYSKIEKSLGWKPKYNVEEGLRAKLKIEGLI